jgi:hypothetical protein
MTWGNNVIIVQSDGIVRIISINKKLRAKTRRPQVLVYYDLLEGIIYEEEDLNFETKPKLFLISTITILNEIVLLLEFQKSKSMKNTIK